MMGCQILTVDFLSSCGIVLNRAWHVMIDLLCRDGNRG